MQLNLLCVGDVVGRPGRQILAWALPRLVKAYQIDCVIVNVENAAAGSGLTPALYEKFLRYGAHLLTMGDHVYRRREIASVLEQSSQLVRPANLPPAAVGKEYAIFQTARGARVAVISLLGRMFMRPQADCPFRAIERVLGQLPHEVRVRVVDMHAEATSEKVAMGWHLDGRVSVVFGTHTHVPTGDEAILPQGTAYITDLGMTGPYDSILGRRKDRVLKSLLTGMPGMFEVAEGDPRLSAVVVTVEADSGKALQIERIMVRPDSKPEAAC